MPLGFWLFLVRTLILRHLQNWKLATWKNLQSQRIVGKAVIVYKSLHGLAPDYLRSGIVYCSSLTNYQLRNTESSLAISKLRANFLKNSLTTEVRSSGIAFLLHGLRPAKLLVNFILAAGFFYPIIFWHKPLVESRLFLFFVSFSIVSCVHLFKYYL